jgi:hypothetical protein
VGSLDVLEEPRPAARCGRRREDPGRHPQVKRFLSDDHFSVDGTLVEAWASLKSFRAKDGN